MLEKNPNDYQEEDAQEEDAAAGSRFTENEKRVSSSFPVLLKMKQA